MCVCAFMFVFACMCGYVFACACDGIALFFYMAFSLTCLQLISLQDVVPSPGNEMQSTL